MRVYQKLIAALVVIFSGLAFVPYVEANFSGSAIWQQFADAYRPKITAENVTFVSALNLQSEHVAVDENFLYSTFNNLTVVDNSNPSKLKVLNKFTTNYVYDLIVSGQYVFAGQQDFGLRSFDVSITLPTILGSNKMKESALGLDLVDEVLYVANGNSGLLLVDAAKPADLPLLSQTDTPGMAIDVASNGNFAFVADGYDGLRVYDVTDKTQPVEVGYLNTPGSALDVTLDGSILYLADGEAGLLILDVSDPAAPRKLSAFNTSGSVERIIIKESYAYLADREGGILILDVRDRTKPEKIASYNTMGGGWDLALSGDYIYVADFPYGVQVLKFIPPVTVDVPSSGGIFTTTPDNVEYTFQPASFSRTAKVRHQPLDGNGVPPSSLLYPKVGPYFIVNARDTNDNVLKVKKAYQISIPYSDEGLSRDQEEALGLYAWDGREWILEPTSQVEVEGNVITATPDELILGGILMDKVKSY